MNQGFPKHERLKSRKVIEQLFSEGKSVAKFPVKVFYLPLDELDNSKAAFAVPKRNFKSAVTRNRIKRQLREAYRLHKHLLSEVEGKNFAMLFLYLGKDKPVYERLTNSMVKLLKSVKE